MTRNKELVNFQKSELKRLQNDLELDLSVRNIILTRSQMICIPQNVGLSDIVATQKRTVYINDCDPNKIPEFMNESDNIRSLRVIRSMIMSPMLD
jgi:Mg2+/Co2+ transporter CorC